MSMIGEYRYSENIDPERIAQARQADIAIRESVGPLNKMSMRIGWHAAFLKNNKLFKFLGFPDENTYREACKVGRSTWHRMISIANGFPNLDEETFLKMSADNAEILMQYVPEKERDADIYIQMASTLTSGEFLDKLVGKRAEVQSVPRDEVVVPFKINMEHGKKEAIEEGIKEFQRLHGIDTEARALELIVAESRDRKTIMGFLAESLPKLRRAKEIVEELNDMDELEQILQDYIEGLAETLEVA